MKKGIRWRVIAAIAIFTAFPASAQNGPTNSLPNPYRSIENWARMPPGRSWGSTAGVAIDPDGKSIWVAERCSANSCVNSNLDPILKFDANGRMVKHFGAGIFVFPHGITVDRQGNVWVTDGQGNGARGHQVIKFSPDGKVMMRLGVAGVAGHNPHSFNMPSSVLVAPNGDIFVGDGHGGNSNDRIVKFDSHGNYLKEWGMKGTGPGEFDIPHALAMDSRGRLFVGDRNNNRIQIFDQDGKYLELVAAIQPSQRHLDRRERHDLCHGFGIGIRVEESRRMEARHSNRLGRRRLGEIFHSRSRREGDHDQRRGRCCGGQGRDHLWRRGRAEAPDALRHAMTGG